jgi:hypothetical protein
VRTVDPAINVLFLYVRRAYLEAGAKAITLFDAA